MITSQGKLAQCKKASARDISSYSILRVDDALHNCNIGYSSQRPLRADGRQDAHRVDATGRRMQRLPVVVLQIAGSMALQKKKIYKTEQQQRTYIF